MGSSNRPHVHSRLSYEVPPFSSTPSFSPRLSNSYSFISLLDVTFSRGLTQPLESWLHAVIAALPHYSATPKVPPILDLACWEGRFVEGQHKVVGRAWPLGSGQC